MHILINRWIWKCQETHDARVVEEEALAAAIAAPLPKNLRPAEPSDIVEGAILWYPSFHDAESGNNPETTPLWLVVEDVYYPSDRWKAYCANDGCRYGLDGAFVEIE